MTSSNGNFFRVTGPLCGEFTGWINNRKAGDLRRNRGHYDVTVMHQSQYGPLFKTRYHQISWSLESARQWSYCFVRPMNRELVSLITDYSTDVHIVSCTFSSDSVLSESTGLFNPVLSVSVNEISTDIRPGGTLFSLSTWWLQQAFLKA